MGFHMWQDRCPHCGFEEMVVQSCGPMWFEAACPMCGYELAPGELVPDSRDVELVKEAIARMSPADREAVIESWWATGEPLVVRLKAQA